MGTGSFNPGFKRPGREVDRSIVAPRLGMNAAISQLPFFAFMA
jgi:hypothetical protein